MPCSLKERGSILHTVIFIFFLKWKGGKGPLTWSKQTVRLFFFLRVLEEDLAYFECDGHGLRRFYPVRKMSLSCKKICSTSQILLSLMFDTSSPVAEVSLRPTDVNVIVAIFLKRWNSTISQRPKK